MEEFFEFKNLTFEIISKHKDSRNNVNSVNYGTETITC